MVHRHCWPRTDSFRWRLVRYDLKMKVRLRLVFKRKKGAISYRASYIDSSGMALVMTYPRDPKRPLRCIPGQLIQVTEEEAARMIASGDAMTPTAEELRAYSRIKRPGWEGTGLAGEKVG